MEEMGMTNEQYKGMLLEKQIQKINEKLKF